MSATKYPLPPGHPDHSCMYLDDPCDSCRPRGCMCKSRPACENHAHDPATEGCAYHGHITLGFSMPSAAEGPPCIWCNAPTRRTGACFTCVMCGSTTSC